MMVSVTSEGKKLVDSGIFNGAFTSANQVVFNFNYIGLRVKLEIKLFLDPPGDQPPVKMPDFTIGIEDGVVVMRQPYKFTDKIGIDSGYTGMLKPFEIGVRPDGKKIYMSWKLDVHRSVGGDLVSQLLYSFYEDE